MSRRENFFSYVELGKEGIILMFSTNTIKYLKVSNGILNNSQPKKILSNILKVSRAALKLFLKNFKNFIFKKYKFKF